MNDRNKNAYSENQSLHQHQSSFYQIQIDGRITPSRFVWFDDLVITTSGNSDNQPVTTLTGGLVDQAALLGTLQKLYSLGFTLLSVQRMEGPDLFQSHSDRLTKPGP